MSPRRAFTMVEVFVVIAIIGLLLALLAPAIGMAREAAWRAKCLSNLRQIGAALHLYEAAHATFPGWRFDHSIKFPGEPPLILNHHASILVHLLPFLEQQETYDQLNFSRIRLPSEKEENQPEWDMIATAAKRRIAVFLCPSDGAKLSPGVNYRGCFGSGPHYKFTGEFPDSGNGFFAQLYDSEGGTNPIRTRTISDGLSLTAMLSERLKGSGEETRFDPRRDFTFLRSGPTTADETMVLCRRLHELRLQEIGGSYPWGGLNWVSTGLEHTLYNHTMPPNSGVADCVAPIGGGMWGPSSARSAHPGGVQVVFGDGSGRFIQDSIDLHVWRAIATRNGRETVLTGSF